MFFGKRQRLHILLAMKSAPGFVLMPLPGEALAAECKMDAQDAVN